MTTAKKDAAGKRKPLLIAATLVFVLIGIAYAIWWALYAAHFESTDDAYVHGNLVQVTSQIAGTVVGIGADDTQLVSRGKTMIELDGSDTTVDLQRAMQALAQAVRHTRTIFVQNDALQADIAMRKADIERAKVDLAKEESDLKRRQALAHSGGVSGEEILHAQTAVKAAQSGLAQAEAALTAAKAKLQTNQALTRGTDVADHPDVMQAASQLRKAWLDSARTRIPAPVDGMVAQRSVQLGQHVSAGTPLMTIVPLNQLWVEANFKEGQVRHMEPGMAATVVADLYGGDVVYHGTVQGLAAGTGSAFALLPAQNASGNWIKVVQRVPVRIALDPEELAAHPLRVGLSLRVEVDLRETGEAPPPDHSSFATAVFSEDSTAVDAMISGIIHDNLGS